MKRNENSYKNSGVNISLANKLVKHISNISKKGVKKTSFSRGGTLGKRKIQTANPLRRGMQKHDLRQIFAAAPYALANIQSVQVWLLFLHYFATLQIPQHPWMFLCFGLRIPEFTGGCMFGRVFVFCLCCINVVNNCCRALLQI